MSEIKVGDLVQVVKATICCNHPSGSEGKFFVVNSIENFGRMRCSFCDFWTENTIAAIRASGAPIEVERLKRIPPLAELEGLKSEDELPIEHKVKT